MKLTNEDRVVCINLAKTRNISIQAAVFLIRCYIIDKKGIDIQKMVVNFDSQEDVRKFEQATTYACSHFAS